MMAPSLPASLKVVTEAEANIATGGEIVTRKEIVSLAAKCLAVADPQILNPLPYEKILLKLHHQKSSSVKQNSCINKGHSIDSPIERMRPS